MHVELATSAYTPIAVEVPDASVAIVPVSETAHPRTSAGMLAVTAPDADTVPDMLRVEPETGAESPAMTPFTTLNVSGPVRFDPSDCPPVQVPVYKEGSVEVAAEPPAAHAATANRRADRHARFRIVPCA